MQNAKVINAITRGEEPYYKNGSFIIKTKSQGARAPTVGGHW